MKKVVLLVLLFGGGLAFAQMPSSGTIGTGADLAHHCADRPPVGKASEAVDAAYAQGYCFGVLTTAAEILDSDGQIHFPDGASFAQIQKIVTNYLNAHPEEWQKPASQLVKKALKQAWGTS
ncbi:MAG TPA: Rap1a/Tai family immunity protein [Candidatus Sulfotelmatobacter sp.]|nr:Rap1a/Tai family immunity protein [Candidatus Sulfotelmatobacter sp.]